MTSQKFWTDETEKAVQHLNFIAGPVSLILCPQIQNGTVVNIRDTCFEDGKTSTATILVNSQKIGFPTARMKLKPELVLFKNDHILFEFTRRLTESVIGTYGSSLYQDGSLFRELSTEYLLIHTQRFLYEIFSPHHTWQEILSRTSKIQTDIRGPLYKKPET